MKTGSNPSSDSGEGYWLSTALTVEDSAAARRYSREVPAFPSHDLLTCA